MDELLSELPLLLDIIPCCGLFSSDSDTVTIWLVLVLLVLDEFSPLLFICETLYSIMGTQYFEGLVDYYFFLLLLILRLGLAFFKKDISTHVYLSKDWIIQPVCFSPKLYSKMHDQFFAITEFGCVYTWQLYMCHTYKHSKLSNIWLLSFQASYIVLSYRALVRNRFSK